MGGGGGGWVRCSSVVSRCSSVSRVSLFGSSLAFRPVLIPSVSMGSSSSLIGEGGVVVVGVGVVVVVVVAVVVVVVVVVVDVVFVVVVVVVVAMGNIIVQKVLLMDG